MSEWKIIYDGDIDGRPVKISRHEEGDIQVETVATSDDEWSAEKDPIPAVPFAAGDPIQFDGETLPELIENLSDGGFTKEQIQKIKDILVGKASEANFMIAIDRTPVQLRGELLGKILWRGKQWAVTSYGLEALDGTYPIKSDRFLENIDTWPWPRQLNEKEWCDIDEFSTAFMVGLVLHGYSDVRAEDLKKHFSKLPADREDD